MSNSPEQAETNLELQFARIQTFRKMTSASPAQTFHIFMYTLALKIKCK